jgi:thiol-disulfide isomerase/thioredoxin
LPILFYLFPAAKKYIVGEQSPNWLRKCLCLKKEQTNLPPLSKTVKEQLDQLIRSKTTLIKIQSASEYHYLLNAILPTRNICIQWTASWCKPCQEMNPAVIKLANSTQNNDTFIICDLYLLQELSRQCSIAAVPTFQGFSKTKNDVSADTKSVVTESNEKDKANESSEVKQNISVATFTVTGKKEKELLHAVASMVEVQLRGDRISRLEEKTVDKKVNQNKKDQNNTTKIPKKEDEKEKYKKEKKLLLAHHELQTGIKEWKISTVMSVFPLTTNNEEGLKFEVVLCSGDQCQKKIYKVMKDNTVV